MRRIALMAALALLAGGCRTSNEGVSLDLIQAARLLRAYGAARSAPPQAPLPPEAAALSPERLNDLGVMLERRGMFARAEEHYRMAVERRPDFARAWVNLGNVLRHQGRDREALQCYRRALREEPESFEAVNNFADLCADRGLHLEEALALLPPTLERHPAERSAGHDTLGKLLMRAGRPAQAAAAFQAALDMADPRDRAFAAGVLLRLAQAHHAQGDRMAARSAYLRAAALVPPVTEIPARMTVIPNEHSE